MKEIKIIYYSGTGGTKKVAEAINDKLLYENYNVILERIFNKQIVNKDICDLLILLFPLHAANAPQLVYDYIKNLPNGNKTKVAVISISAGGEVIFNRAGRLSSIKLLEKQNYEVIYENSIIMPSNLFIPTPEPLGKELIRVLPKKIDLIIDDLINNKIIKSKPPLIDKCISKVCELEKLGVKILGKTIKANENCDGCGLCEKLCSCGNIKMNNKKPQFDFNCNLCTACLYACPNKALSPRIFKFVLLKNGYNIKSFYDIDNKVLSYDNTMELTKRIYWSGLRSYILDLDKERN